MTKRKPSYCPYCGTELATREFEGRKRGFCSTCQEFVFQNPVPVVRVVVLDGDRSLFIKRGRPPDQGKWTVPGGILEVDEPAAIGAVRELEEETHVCVSPEDVEIVRTGFHIENPDDGSILSICFAVDRDYTTGNPSVGDEPTAVSFWNPHTLLNSDEQTRSVDFRCIEAAFKRLRKEDRKFNRRR